MENSESSHKRNPNPESDDFDRFGKSLQELRDLRPQLHYAADYCETAFLNGNDRKCVMENTKEYICKSMVTVVDHLGTVSTNLDCLLNGGVQVSQTELRIHYLKERILTCHDYTRQLDLAKLRWTTKFPRHHPHYILPSSPPHERSKGGLRVTAKPNEKLTGVVPAPSSIRLNKHNPSLTAGFELSETLTISDGPSIISKPRIPSFRSQIKETHQIGCNEHLSSFLQRHKRTV
ncbi:putative protein ABIL5 isoform X2 [Tasmannia lanceolata]|uniref:putative protein ABIL5 isoform X2 n=1 Tax=Tasmannia lanceolata TaxID=3420 RepID=UPI0040632C28